MLATASLFASISCNHDSAPPPAPSQPQPDAATTPVPSSSTGSASSETVVGSDDDGKTFDVQKGGTITFRLASNAGTGYIWKPTQIDAGILTQQGERTSELASDVPGASKVDVYRFEAQNTGSVPVEMDS